VNAGLLQVGARHAGQFGLDLDADHALRALRQQGSHVTGAGADLEHLLMLLHVGVLKHACLDARREHDLAAGATFAQRNLHVYECQRLVGQGNKIFALHHLQQLQHVGVQPRSTGGSAVRSC
jgi:hypothetical protein